MSYNLSLEVRGNSIDFFLEGMRFSYENSLDLLSCVLTSTTGAHGAGIFNESSEHVTFEFGNYDFRVDFPEFPKSLLALKSSADVEEYLAVLKQRIEIVRAHHPLFNKTWSLPLSASVQIAAIGVSDTEAK